MKYKYKKWQVGKSLKVPKEIKTLIYEEKLSFEDFIKYNLEDKIPISCLKRYPDRSIVERFGIEKSKTLDWELLSKDTATRAIHNKPDFRTVSEALLQIEPNVVDLNKALYEKVKKYIPPKKYSERMKKECPEMIVDLSQITNDDEYRRKNGVLWIYRGVIPYWELLKDKDLSYILNQDYDNRYGITDSQLKECMDNYGVIIKLLNSNEDVYSFVHEISLLDNQNELQEYLKKIVDNIIEKVEKEKYYYPDKDLTNEQYKEIFKYTSLEKYLKKSNQYFLIDELYKELDTLSPNYIFDTGIPIRHIKNNNVLKLINLFGLKNIVDFDNECGNFFSKNDWYNLKHMYSFYVSNYSSLYEQQFNAHSGYDKEYTREKFYEDMRKMIIYSSSGEQYDRIMSIRGDITGRFRGVNHDLFISGKAPDELKQAFYTKRLTPHLVAEHREYIPFLRGRSLTFCFQTKTVEVLKDKSHFCWQNFYEYLESKVSFDELMDFIIEYRDVFDIFDEKQWTLKFDVDASFEDVKKETTKLLRKAIVEYGAKYPTNIPNELGKYYPNMILPSNAPEELKEALYNRTIDSVFILSNSSYRDYLKNMDLNIIFKYMPISIYEEKRIIGGTTIAKAFEKIFGYEEAFDIMLQYGKYIEKCYEKDPYFNIHYNLNMSKDEFLEKIDNLILRNIIDGNIVYKEDMPSHFKENNPTLFLSDNFPKELKDKFYNRKLTLQDFNENPELLKMFGSTNIICGFNEELSWMIPLFENEDNYQLANAKRLKVVSEYLKINDENFKNTFKKYIQKNINNMEIEKIEYISMVLFRLSLSNSSEMYKFRNELATQLLNNDNPIDTLNKIESVFIKNNLPTVGKVYSCFEILHPNFKGFNFGNSKISPILKSKSNMGRKVVAFSDLIKASFGSNNRSVNSYIRNIRIGSELYDDIKNGKIKYDELNESQKQELLTFSNHLTTLYYNTLKGKKDEKVFYPTGDVINNIFELSKLLSPNGNSLNYNLANRVISMFCHFTGIDTLEEAEGYIKTKIDSANTRNRQAASSDMVIETGDFIKGINDIKYLKNILQNGSVSKEYLGSSADSDSTPLDTDVSMITSDGTNDEKINRTEASEYGNIWLVLKNDDRFITTRNSDLETTKDSDLSKLEVFYTGAIGNSHYGIRTGFASSEINYIVAENYDYRIGLEIAMNGFYIPVANKEGKIVFTPNDYDNLRRKMSGLSYYGENTYLFSDNLITEETEYLASKIEESNNEVRIKRDKINRVITKSLEELGLNLKTIIDGDLTEGFVELIDTGSTGRGTNKPGDGDFDFMMRLDNKILQNPTKLSELKNALLKNLGKENTSEMTSNGDFRLKGVKLDNETIVDIDITFTGKTDKISYSTDMCLQERLSNIYNQNPEQYKYVVANILLAKQVLKEAEVYKPNRGEVPQGGLGGVGIENWILQNGGSFIDAATDFLNCAEGKSFDEFKNTYYIWDFGENHMAERRGQYTHDNFVANNMSESGYNKMIHVLREYLNSHINTQNNSINK